MVQGYFQQFEIDFDQIFTVVVKLMAFRVLFSITVYYNLDINQIDIKITFLHIIFDQLVYMQIPKGSKSSTNKGMVL